MAVQKVVQVGHPSLKSKNKTIVDFASPYLKQLINDLKDSMYKADLVGIAAPQIAKNYMVFVTHPRNTKSRKLFREDVFRIFINPKISFYSKEEIVIYEGCGSVIDGSLFGPVLRPKEVKVEAFNENNEKFSIFCDGLLARAIQHEYDHLIGAEFIQKVFDYNKLLSKEYYRKTIRNSKAQKDALKITKVDYKELQDLNPVS